ncbi:MAG: tetratricopeptide repeat protein [Gammaproteobacteria bacterium]|nr:tetratricopeptide repeat protein [Gammaproteobacteria bacterium]
MKKFNIYFYGLILLCVYISVSGCATYLSNSSLAIEVNNEFSKTDSVAATLTVEFSGPSLRNPRSITLDEANGRVLVVDSGLEAVVAVDLKTGAHTILSDAVTPNTANPLRFPISITIDAANNRALVLDSGLKAVVVVDLKTGARTILSDATTPNVFYAFEAPEGIVLDAANDRALVLDSSMDAVVAVDLTTGVRSISSYVTDLISRMGDIALDVANGRVLVAGTGLNLVGGVEAVDLKSGVRSILSNATTSNTANPLRFPISITIDAANNRALVIDGGLKAVVAVDLKTGARTILSDERIPNAVNLFDSPRSIALDAANDRALVVDSRLKAVVAVDLKTGARTIISDTPLPKVANLFDSPRSIALDAANDRALVVDSRLKAVVAVDLKNGARTILSDATTPNAANRFRLPVGIALDAANDRALVVDYGSRVRAVVAVDLKTGARTILSDDRTPNAVNRFGLPRGIALDAVNGRALVMDYGFPRSSAILAVDLATGARTILSDDRIPNKANRFRIPKSSTLDVINGRALVVDSELDAVVAVDLKTGARTILSDATTPNAANSFDFPQSIALDTLNDRALVVDSGLDAVMAVDLKTGVRTILSDATTPNMVNRFRSPVGIVLDAANNRALVVDSKLNAVVAVDLKAGARTILSDARTPLKVLNTNRVGGVSYSQIPSEKSYSKGIEYAIKGEFRKAKTEFENGLNVADSSYTSKLESLLETTKDVLSKKIKKETAIYLFRGLSIANKGSYDLAIEEYNKAIAINSKYAKAYFTRGIIQQQQGLESKKYKAINDFTKTIELNPKHAKAYLSRGVLIASKGQHGKAIKDFDKAIKLNPQYANAYNNRGGLYFQMKYKFEGCVDIKKSCGLGLNIACTNYKSLNCSSIKEKPVDKLTDEASNGDTLAQYYLGKKYEYGRGVKQDTDEAIKWYKKAATQGLVEAQVKLGYMYKGQGAKIDNISAAKWFGKAADQGDNRAQYVLGLMYLKGEIGQQKNIKKAVELLVLSAIQKNELAISVLIKLGIATPLEAHNRVVKGL